MSDKQSDLAKTLAERFQKLGNDQFKAGEYEKAVNLYTKSLDKVKSWEAFSNRAAAYLKLESYNHALEDCSQVLSIDGNNFKGLFRLAQTFFGMKQNVAAIGQCEYCLNLWPENPDVIKLLKEIKLIAVDSEVFRFNSWKQLTEKLRSCHTPIKRVDITEYFNEDAMECFRLIDPICFSEFIFFYQVDFSKIRGSFRELFDGLVEATNLAVMGLKGVDSATLCHALNNFSCFRNALLINLCDPFEKWGKPLVIEISILLSFLHSSNRKSQLLMIAYCSLNVGIEELWDMLAEKFMRDKKKFSYFLEVQCPKKIVKPKEREMRNLKTSEVLWMRTDMPNILAVGPAVNDSSSGFVLGIRRMSL